MKCEIEARLWVTVDLPDGVFARQGQDLWSESSDNMLFGMLCSELQRQMDNGELRLFRRGVQEPISACRVNVPACLDTDGTQHPSKA